MSTSIFNVWCKDQCNADELEAVQKGLDGLSRKALRHEVGYEGRHIICRWDVQLTAYGQQSREHTGFRKRVHRGELAGCGQRLKG